MASASATPQDENEQPSFLQFNEIMAAIHSMSRDIHTTNKELMALRVEHETLARRTTEGGTRDRHRHGNHHRDRSPDDATNDRRDLSSKVRMDAPRFAGVDPEDWIHKVETYFDYNSTPDSKRLYFTTMLIDPPTSKWFC